MSQLVQKVLNNSIRFHQALQHSSPKDGSSSPVLACRQHAFSRRTLRRLPAFSESTQCCASLHLRHSNVVAAFNTALHPNASTVINLRRKHEMYGFYRTKIVSNSREGVAGYRPFVVASRPCIFLSAQLYFTEKA